MRSKSSKVLLVCPICQNEFLTWPAWVRNGVKCCSKKCSDASKTVPLEERFWRYVGRKQPNGCILWTGCKDKDGYGQIANKAASRVSYEIFIGPIPNGMLVCHACDTPPCISPRCLFLGTNDDNMTDRQSKMRQAHGSGTGTAKLTETNVLEIRRKYANGGIRQQDLADEYGVVQTIISRIIRRESWKHI